jgi:hypothetical protein
MSSRPRLRASMPLSPPKALSRPNTSAWPSRCVRARHGPSGGERRIPRARPPSPGDARIDVIRVPSVPVLGEE